MTQHTELKFLIVDDFSTMRRIVRGLLKEMGCHNAEEAEDGVAALQMLRNVKFDFVVSDINMPNMNGIEFLRALRKEQGGDRPIVLFCTTENEISFMMQAIEAGANEYIMKPFDRELIESKLSEVGLR